MGIFEKIFGDWNANEIKRIEKIVAKVEALDEKMQKMTERELKDMTPYLKGRLSDGETLDGTIDGTTMTLDMYGIKITLEKQ